MICITMAGNSLLTSDTHYSLMFADLFTVFLLVFSKTWAHYQNIFYSPVQKVINLRDWQKVGSHVEH